MGDYQAFDSSEASEPVTESTYEMAKIWIIPSIATVTVSGLKTRKLNPCDTVR